MYYGEYTMQYRKVIEQLGYSPKEAKVYMTALRLGEALVSDIAQKSGYVPQWCASHRRQASR